jgi:hypothetical protein
MCLALLVIGALFLFTAMLVRRRLVRLTARHSNKAAHPHHGRAPPASSIFELSVLRL